MQVVVLVVEVEEKQKAKAKKDVEEATTKEESQRARKERAKMVRKENKSQSMQNLFWLWSLEWSVPATYGCEQRAARR